MFQWLIDLDKTLFLFLNGINSPEWDSVMVWISAKYSWIPLYAILVFTIIYRERPYNFIYTIVFVIIVIFLCDQSSNLFKALTERLRPCNDPAIRHLVHTVNGCRGSFSFFSAHASNTFGLAAFLACWFKCNKWGVFLFSWAAIKSYSRIYLGVHFPLDIICGAAAGIVIGLTIYGLYVRVMVYLERKIKDRKAAKRRLEKAKNNKLNK